MGKEDKKTNKTSEGRKPTCSQHWWRSTLGSGTKAVTSDLAAGALGVVFITELQVTLGQPLWASMDRFFKRN